MAEELLEQTAIPAGEQNTASEQETLPGTNSSETGAGQTAPEQTPEANANPAEAAKPNKSKDQWWQRRINELSRERKEAQERATQIEADRARLQAEIEAFRRGDTETHTPQQTQPDIERVVSERLAAERKAASFNDRCNAVFESGKKEYADFDKALGQFQLLGEVPQHFLEATTLLEHGHKVLHHLGSNLDEAAEILSLPPVQQAIKLAALDSQLSRPKPNPVSRAPAPITPIDGTGKSDVDLSKASIDDFMNRRNREAPIKKW